MDFNHIFGSDLWMALKSEKHEGKLYKYDRTASVSAMLQRLEWETLQQRRLKLRLTLMYKIVHGLVAIKGNQYFHPANRSTRSSHSLKFRQIQATHSYHQASFFIRTIPTWNAAPAIVTEAMTLEAFKGALAKIQLPHP